MKAQSVLVEQPSDLHQILRQTFGYKQFRQSQKEIIQTIIDGENVLAIMPTGAGKSMCYQIPALLLPGFAIVVSPLVSLMQDQIASLGLSGVAAAAINSSQDRQTNIEIWNKVTAGKIKLLYMAPERLMTERMLSALAKLPVSLIAIDEAHCISQWGPAFRPEYAELTRLQKVFSQTPIVAMTATADEATRKDIEIQLFAGANRTFLSGFDRPNICLEVSTKRDWKSQLLDFLTERTDQSGIVYCLSRRKTEETSAFLNEHGFNSLPYHAGLSSELRLENQNRFLTEPAMIIAATVAFGMGIDKPDVRFVFHADLPASMEAYYQEIGRAGRDGDPANATMIFGANDVRVRRQFIDQENDADDARRLREHKRFDSLMAFCDANTCRRQTLLNYFGQQSEPCGNCDNCINPVELQDMTELALQVTGVILDTGERFGQAHLIDVLRGSNSEKIKKFSHDQLESFATGKSLRKENWQQIIRQMVASGFLEIDVTGFGALHITQQGSEMCRGQGKFMGDPRILDPITNLSKTRNKSKSLTTPSPLADDEAQLLKALKQKRLELANLRGVPAYVIFPDKALIEMTRARPCNLEEFSAVKGVGLKKLNSFGPDFLNVILDH